VLSSNNNSKNICVSVCVYSIYSTDLCSSYVNKSHAVVLIADLVTVIDVTSKG